MLDEPGETLIEVGAVYAYYALLSAFVTPYLYFQRRKQPPLTTPTPTPTMTPTPTVTPTPTPTPTPRMALPR